MRDYDAQLKQQRTAAATKYRALQHEMQDEQVASDQAITRMQGEYTEIERQLNRARTALRAEGKGAAEAHSALESELEKARSGRVWAKVHEEEQRRLRAEAVRDEMIREVDRVNTLLNERNSATAHEKQQLAYYRFRAQELEKKVSGYQVG